MISPILSRAAPAGNSDEGVILRSISKTFSLKGRSVQSLAGITAEVSRNSFVSIMGPSGCGKSTLLRITAGLLQPTSGTISVHGLQPRDFLSSGKLGMAFQDPALFPWRNVHDNVRLPLEILGQPSSTHKVGDLLKLFGLADWQDTKPASLSGGMKERVALARALATNPSVLLLDEPFRSLDEMTRLHMILEIQNIWMQFAPTTIMVTHSIDDALVLSDKVFMLSDKPAVVEVTWDVPLGRPRRTADLRSPEYMSLRSEITEFILSDSNKQRRTERDDRD